MSPISVSPSGPPDGIAPIAATPRSERPRRTNQSDTQKSAHYPRHGGNRHLLEARLLCARAALRVLALERPAPAQRARPQKRRARLGLVLPAARARAAAAQLRAAARDPPPARPDPAPVRPG